MDKPALYGPGLLGPIKPRISSMLVQRFAAPPFSILDTRQGYWRSRKLGWLNLGIQSELGRNDTPTSIAHGKWQRGAKKRTANENATDESESLGISIFDPVLCELLYTWLTPHPKAMILDPFAGGSVRGIVAAVLGHRYTGVDLSERQIIANRAQAELIVPHNKPRWHVGDAIDVQKLAPNKYDLIIACPPYADLERYSDDPRDISTYDYPKFISKLRAIIARSVAMLKDNRFAVFVVGDVRDKKGFYRNFPAHTLDALQAAGARLWNWGILVQAVGSLSVRVGRMFTSTRKLGKGHQDVLICYKGDPKAMKAWPALYEKVDRDG